MEPNELTASDAATIRSLLQECKPGEIVSYDAMTAAIGRDVHQRRHAIAKALRALMSEARVVFSAVRGVGYQRLDDAGIVATGADSLQRIRRTSRRGVKKLVCVDFENLSPEQRLSHNTRMTVLAMVGDATSGASVKRVEAAVKDANAALPAARAAVAAMGKMA